MRLPAEIVFILCALLALALVVAPSVVIGLVFVVVLWKLWRHRSRGRGVR